MVETAASGSYREDCQIVLFSRHLFLQSVLVPRTEYRVLPLSEVPVVGPLLQTRWYQLCFINLAIINSLRIWLLSPISTSRFNSLHNYFIMSGRRWKSMGIPRMNLNEKLVSCLSLLSTIRSTPVPWRYKLKPQVHLPLCDSVNYTPSTGQYSQYDYFPLASWFFLWHSFQILIWKMNYKIPLCRFPKTLRLMISSIRGYLIFTCNIGCSQFVRLFFRLPCAVEDRHRQLSYGLNSQEFTLWLRRQSTSKAIW